ncbi:MAG: hypothetical protein ACTSYQ_02960 [Candidatus Odinarchaeia archaeon]
MEKTNKTPSESKPTREIYTPASLLIIGAIITALLSWYYGGFGYWDIPGIIVISIGFGVLIYNFSEPMLKTPNSFYRGGLFIFLIGLAFFIPLIPHILLGTYQIMSFALILIGITITLYGIYKGIKT